MRGGLIRPYALIAFARRWRTRSLWPTAAVKPRIKIISFADGAFASRSNAFVAQARAMELYDSITVHNLASLPASFAEQHGAFMRSNARGFGFWIWKPLIVLNELLTSAKDDVVVYADVGFTQSPQGRERMLEYIELRKHHGIKCSRF